MQTNSSSVIGRYRRLFHRRNQSKSGVLFLGLGAVTWRATAGVVHNIGCSPGVKGGSKVSIDQPHLTHISQSIVRNGRVPPFSNFREYFNGQIRSDVKSHWNVCGKNCVSARPVGSTMCAPCGLECAGLHVPEPMRRSPFLKTV